MHRGGGHEIRAQVDQQIVVDQCRASLPHARTAERTGPLTVLAPAEGIRIALRGGGSQEGETHFGHPSTNVGTIVSWHNDVGRIDVVPQLQYREDPRVRQRTHREHTFFVHGRCLVDPFTRYLTKAAVPKLPTIL